MIRVTLNGLCCPFPSSSAIITWNESGWTNLLFPITSQVSVLFQCDDLRKKKKRDLCRVAFRAERPLATPESSFESRSNLFRPREFSAKKKQSFLFKANGTAR